MSTSFTTLRNDGSQSVVIVGAGAWGTTLALVALRAGNSPTLVVRDPDQATFMDRNRRHPRSLPGVSLPEPIRITPEAETAIAAASIVIFAVPTQSLREAIIGLGHVLSDKVVVSAAKGLEQGTLRRPTQIVGEAIRSGSDVSICALSGPNLASEVAAGQPATTVVACRDARATERVRRALMSSQFRVYGNEDIVGVEMGGALKNIIAIGAGIGDGLGAGDNAKAAFLTRGIAEIARLGIACGAEPLTFAGLSGIGDLIATCASPLSRNNRVGRELAKGRRLDDILSELSETAEGVPTTEAAYTLGDRLGVDLPITAQMHAVLFGGKSPLDAVRELMSREPKQELTGLSE